MVGTIGNIDGDAPKWSFLREDLVLLEGAPDRHGAPSWTLQDPVAGKFYKIGWLEFEVLSRWYCANPNMILSDIISKTLLRPTVVDIQNLYQFLTSNFLLQDGSKQTTQKCIQAHYSKRQQSIFKMGVKNYLFFRIPLCRPDHLLNRLKPLGDALFKKSSAYMMIVLLCLSLFLVFRDFSAFLSGFQVLQTPSGMIGGFAVLAFSKVVHEMGHALLSKRYGCRVPAMGVAFIVMWPLLWTDTTDAWRLRSHKQRLHIDAGGMLFELSLAIIASILWGISPDGGFKDAMHMLAGVTWIMTLAVNLNPFMRFDGYYLLSDAVDTPNLQDRSFKMAKWWMRLKLWGMREQKPESFTRFKESWMIAYAFGTWVYRFFLFLGIALLVYHFFFKALGVMMFVVEMWWFILRPVQQEIAYWFKNRETVSMAKSHKIFMTILVVGGLVLFLVPWKGTVSAPAIYKATKEISLVAMSAAKINIINVSNGDNVKKGDVLFILEDLDVTQDLKLSKIKYDTISKDYSNRATNSSTYKDATLLLDDIKRTRAEIDVLKAKAQELIISAPIDGTVIDISDDILQSKWVGKREILGLLKSSKSQGEAFVEETDLAYFTSGAGAIFYDESGEVSKLSFIVERIDTSPVKNILYPELGADKGGDIAISYHPETHDPMPAQRLYRIVLQPVDDLDIDKTMVGTMRIDTKPQSLFSKVYKKVVSIIIQESGL